MDSHTLHPLSSAVDTVIEKRCTIKVMGDLDNPPLVPDDFIQRVEQSIQVAGAAPFHYPANQVHLNTTMDSAVPWRFYALEQKNCLLLADALIENGDVPDKQAGLIRMMAAAGSLVLVTWLPEPEAVSSDKIAHRNMEHVAAASAAIQNLLLSATARDIQTYWSSGGALGGNTCYEMCNIPLREKLLGAIFMFPEEAVETLDSKLGAHRNKRGAPDQWRSWRTISSSK